MAALASNGSPRAKAIWIYTPMVEPITRVAMPATAEGQPLLAVLRLGRR